MLAQPSHTAAVGNGMAPMMVPQAMARRVNDMTQSLEIHAVLCAVAGHDIHNASRAVETVEANMDATVARHARAVHKRANRAKHDGLLALGHRLLQEADRPVLRPGEPVMWPDGGIRLHDLEEFRQKLYGGGACDNGACDNGGSSSGGSSHIGGSTLAPEAAIVGIEVALDGAVRTRTPSGLPEEAWPTSGGDAWENLGCAGSHVAAHAAAEGAGMAAVEQAAAEADVGSIFGGSDNLTSLLNDAWLLGVSGRDAAGRCVDGADGLVEAGAEEAGEKTAIKAATSEELCEKDEDEETEVAAGAAKDSGGEIAIVTGASLHLEAGCDKVDAVTADCGNEGLGSRKLVNHRGPRPCPCCNWNQSWFGSHGLVVSLLVMFLWRFSSGVVLILFWLGMEYTQCWHSRDERSAERRDSRT